MLQPRKLVRKDVDIETVSPDSNSTTRLSRFHFNEDPPFVRLHCGKLRSCDEMSYNFAGFSH